jgi:hypothetical protein
MLSGRPQTTREKDEYFSAERYCGTLPYLSASWSRLGRAGGYRLGIEQRHSSDIRGGTLSSGVTQFTLSLDFLHRVTDFAPFARDATLFLGLSTGLFMHFSELDIAYAELEIPHTERRHPTPALDTRNR